MINAVNGVVVEINANGIVVNAGGLEFQLETSARCSAYFSAHVNREPVRVLTVFQVREDAMTLFGFMDKAERDCFIQLVKVPGIAGKGALKILSAISVNDFIRALDNRDISTLSRVPGIGSKTAQKLVLQLRDTLVYDENEPGAAQSGQTQSSRTYEDVVESFVGMGFDKKTVLKALDRLLAKEKDNLRSKTKEECENYIFPLLLRSLT